mmetsp:Transcript_8451/g.12231  ORF Transcript_8451/g.12231 Transcript_8451/m.12231 type:complete len:297 (-) Transcript_8451:662-1552(-)
MASICLRACWSMGPVKDRYIHYEKAGNQFTGRCVTGISSLDKTFAISPVYWDWAGCASTAEKSVDDVLEATCVEKNGTKPQTFGLLRYLFACLCYHYKYLDEKLHETSQLRASSVFIEAAVFEHADRATTAFPWNATSYTPKFTGVPPHVMILVKMEELKVELAKQSEVIADKLKAELDARSVGGSEYRATALLQEVKEMVQMMKEQASVPFKPDAIDADDTFYVGDLDFGTDDVADSNFEDNTAHDGKKTGNRRQSKGGDRFMIRLGENGRLCLFQTANHGVPKFCCDVVLWRPK